MKVRECSNCRSTNLEYLPWAGGQIWVCKDCGNRSIIVIEREE
jgi:ribosomal protein L37AE/L43A